MHVICPACGSTLSLPQAIAVATMIECTGCRQCFEAVPPRREVLAAITVPSKSRRRAQPAPAVAQKPVVLPPRGSSRKGVSHPPITSPPPVIAQPYEVVPKKRAFTPDFAEEAPITASLYEPAAEASPYEAPPAKPKKKRFKRFKKKVADDSSDDHTAGIGAQIVYSLVVIGIMVALGAFFGVGRFGWIKNNKLVDFNDKVVTLIDQASNDISVESVWSGNAVRSPHLHNQLTRALQELNNLSVPSEGQAFHQAAVRFLQRLDQIFSNELGQLRQLAESGNQAQAEQRLKQITQEITTLENAVIDAQAEMARRNNMQLSSGHGSMRHRLW